MQGDFRVCSLYSTNPQKSEGLLIQLYLIICTVTREFGKARCKLFLFSCVSLARERSFSVLFSFRSK